MGTPRIFTVDADTGLLTATGHRLVSGAPLTVASADTLPGPLVAETTYYARDVDGDLLRLTETKGGSAVGFSDEGVGVHTLRDTDLSPLDTLVLDVEAYFAAKSYPEVIAWGRRELTKQINQAPGRAGRVVFVPGDDTGKAGKIGPVHGPGRNPRPIYGWDELAEVHVWGRDGSAPNDDRAHYRVTWDLFERVLRAIRRSPTSPTMNEPKWTIVPTERVFGAELVFQLTVQANVVDEASAAIGPAPNPNGPVGTSYEIEMGHAGGDVTTCEKPAPGP